MVTSFLIATLIIFILNLVLSLISFGVSISQDEPKIGNFAIFILMILIFLTWNIFALISL